MRCVAAPAAGGLVPSSALDETELDAVRYLNTRFPGARLREVPLVRAFELDPLADPSGATRIWLALEALQVTGTFKVRGALVSLDAQRSRRRVVAAGGHNHLLAVAYAARVLGVAATLFLPRGVSRNERFRLERYGAELVVAGDREEQAEAAAQEMAAAGMAAYLSSHDDLDVVRGSGASLGFEIVRALGGVPEHVLVPVGRGALATGLAWALAAEGKGQVDRGVWGVESESECVMATAIEEGRAARASHAHPRTWSEASLSRALAAVAGVIVAADTAIQSAMAHAHRDMGLVIEWRAAAALAPVLFGLPSPAKGGDLVVVLTGRNVAPERFDSVLQGATDGRV